MVEELKRQIVEAEEYWKSGGRLNRDSFERVRGVLSEEALEEKRMASVNAFAQVKSMERVSQVPITPVQAYLYAVLRDMKGEVEGRPDSPPETVPGCALTDQRFMAEVIRVTGDLEKLGVFMEAYPHIFKPIEPAGPTIVPEPSLFTGRTYLNQPPSCYKQSNIWIAS